MTASTVESRGNAVARTVFHRAAAALRPPRLPAVLRPGPTLASVRGGPRRGRRSAAGARRRDRTGGRGAGHRRPQSGGRRRGRPQRADARCRADGTFAGPSAKRRWSCSRREPSSCPSTTRASTPFPSPTCFATSTTRRPPLPRWPGCCDPVAPWPAWTSMCRPARSGAGRGGSTPRSSCRRSVCSPVVAHGGRWAAFSARTSARTIGGIRSSEQMRDWERAGFVEVGCRVMSVGGGMVMWGRKADAAGSS